MTPYTISFAHTRTDIYFNTPFRKLSELAPPDHSFIITDEHLMQHYQQVFKPWRSIVVAPGESAKRLDVLDDILRQLIALEAGRDAIIVGVGGGVITDIAGFVAGIYKRGVRCGLVPTSVLAMVDAAVGGKNGLDIGEYKNMIGLTRQPEFLLYDYTLLDTLPPEEWMNGFAEVIKHGCIADSGLLEQLQQHHPDEYRSDGALLGALIERNVLIKAGYVTRDELEKGARRELNFGHTLAHAIENIYGLPHGHAVSIGMAFAAHLSARQTGFAHTERLVQLLQQYRLPVRLPLDSRRVFQLMLADKKRNGDRISYVLLEDAGKAVVRDLDINIIKNELQEQESKWK